VADAMIANSCLIGGEGNGGVIDMRVGPVRDSLVAISLILQLMATTGKKISELVDEIPKYVIKKDKFNADNAMAAKIIDAAKQKFTDAKIDTTDGARFDFDEGWFLLRTSNTEPIMRIMVEASTESAANKYYKAIDDIRSQFT
jgi:phosphomannomutase